jgi:hypothetical protein
MTLDRYQRAALFGTKPRKSDEEDWQIALVQHLELRRMPGVIFYAIPNGGLRSKSEAVRLKKMGVRPGASDIGFIIPPDGLAAMLECKAGKNKPSPEQEQFGVEVEAAGALFAVAWNIDQALNILTAWRVIRPEAEL